MMYGIIHSSKCQKKRDRPHTNAVSFEEYGTTSSIASIIFICYFIVLLRGVSSKCVFMPNTIIAHKKDAQCGHLCEQVYTELQLQPLYSAQERLLYI